MRRVGILEPRPSGGGTLTTEPILVFYKPELGGRIFDQSGRCVGKVARDREYTPDRRDYWELRDAEARCVLRDTTKAGWTAKKTFLVVGPDGSPIATTQMGRFREFAFLAEPGGATIATLRKAAGKEFRSTVPRLSEPSWRERAWRVHDRYVRTGVVYLEDVSGARVARITFLLTSYGALNWAVVLELESGLREPVPTIALAGCVITCEYLTPSMNG